MPTAPGAAVLAEELPPGKDTERFTAWGCSCSLPRPMELAVDLSRRVLSQSPPCSSPTYVAGQGADEGHEEGNQASLCLQALPILQWKNSAHVIMVLAASLCQRPYSLPLSWHPNPKHPTHLERLEGAGKTVLGQEGDLSIQEEGHDMRHTLGSQPRQKETSQYTTLGGSPESSWVPAPSPRCSAWRPTPASLTQGSGEWWQR